MYISIGTPPIRVIPIVDTGSDLICTQCEPCQNCLSQKDTLFDPTSSFTYNLISCKSKPCEFITQDKCSSTRDFCNYSYTYGLWDSSFTTGNLSLETVTLDYSIDFPNTIFGRGHQDEGVFGGIESGIVGLGGGPLSLISQMGPSVNRKFSYCLLIPLASY